MERAKAIAIVSELISNLEPRDASKLSAVDAKALRKLKQAKGYLEMGLAQARKPAELAKS